MPIQDHIIKISEWNTPATSYPETQVGTARITRSPYSRGYYNSYWVRGYKYFRVIKPIPITSLEIREDEEWNTWMVDDPPHWWSMQDYATNSIGSVLVAGLGLGLIVHTLSDNIDIDSITVIEKNKDVIDLISPLLPKIKEIDFKIINADFYDFIHESEKEFDRLIIDLWTSGSSEETEKLLTEEIEPLSAYLLLKYPDSSAVFHGFGVEW